MFSNKTKSGPEKKTTVAVVFGGQSSEHDVSCVSAETVIRSIDPDRYEILMIGITQEGKWIQTDSVDDIASGKWRDGDVTMTLSPDRTRKGFLAMKPDKTGMKTVAVDVVFPVLHGLYGEDGTVQGVLELAGIPYVGCGVAASAVSMDKLLTKRIVASLGTVRQAAFVPLRRERLADMEACVKEVEARLPYPVFIKPANAGSSKGVSKASDRNGLIAGLRAAAEHDEKILVEEAIIGREIECAVLGGNEINVSGVGEVLAAGDADFYDYDAKYNNAQSKTDIHPVLPEGKEEEIRNDAAEIFRAVDGFGLARIDFFLEKDTGDVVFNELNTMPGFTPISMYPMLWEAKGLDKSALVDELIRLAFQRHRQG